jgi:hypothetical protein
MHNQKPKSNQATEAESIRGKNGKSLFSDWYKPEESADDSREEITRLYRVRGDY